MISVKYNGCRLVRNNASHSAFATIKMQNKKLAVESQTTILVIELFSKMKIRSKNSTNCLKVTQNNADSYTSGVVVASK